jgi:rfaE bifunctional protein nucleotidyltransferase chain/domain
VASVRSTAKIRNVLADTDAWVEARRAAGERIGFTCGAFDLLHPGHVQYLEEARALCDALLVAVNSDASVRRYKSALRPVNPLAERQAVLAGLCAVDAVTVLEEDRPLGLIERWRPELYIKGGDYAPEKLRSAATVAAYGGRTVVIPMDRATSTSKVIDRIDALLRHAAPEPAATRAPAAVFLDRDGTLIDNVPFLHEPDRVRVREGVIDGLLALQAAGFRLVVVTNQQGVGIGYFDMRQMIAVNQRLLAQLGAAGVAVDRVYFCPHSLADGCDCRKPKPGLLLRAAREMALELGGCFLIGDTESDSAAAQAAGVRAQQVGPERGFEEAVRWVLAQ